MIRSLVLFAHVIGVLVLFGGLGLEWLSLGSLRQSTARAEAMPWVRASAFIPRVYGIASALILLSGFYLGGRGGVLGDSWLLASYGALVLNGIAGGPMAGPRLRAIRRAADDPSERGLSALRTAASDALLGVSLRVRIIFSLAVIYLMIAKPDASDSLFVLGLAGILATVTSIGKRHAQFASVEGYR
jgi:uncharacterized membrane protein